MAMQLVTRQFAILVGRDFYRDRGFVLAMGWVRNTDPSPGVRTFERNFQCRLWPLLDLLWWQSVWYWRGRRLVLVWPCGIKIAGQYRRWW